MSLEALRDLDLAGVRWEITELPTAMAIAAAAAAAATNTDVAPQNRPIAPDEIQIPDSMRTPVFSAGPAVCVPPVAPVSLDTARGAAARPADIGALMRMIEEFNHPLRTMAQHVVLPHIAQNPNGLLILSDTPSADDDAAGKILTGAAGELLDKMLGAIGMGRDAVSIMPMLFWRTPGGRAATRTELDLAKPFTDRVIEMLNPSVIVTLGTMPAAEFARVALASAHGVPVRVDNRMVVPIFHPNYLILKPAAKRDAWTALQLVQNLLKSPEK